MIKNIKIFNLYIKYKNKKLKIDKKNPIFMHYLIILNKILYI